MYQCFLCNRPPQTQGTQQEAVIVLTVLREASPGCFKPQVCRLLGEALLLCLILLEHWAAGTGSSHGEGRSARTVRRPVRGL